MGERDGHEPGVRAGSPRLSPTAEAPRALAASPFGWDTDSFDTGSQITLWRVPRCMGGEPQQPVPARLGRGRCCPWMSTTGAPAAIVSRLPRDRVAGV